MNRRYTAEEYYEKCEILRKYFENPALTTDVIVGFPGETEEEFAESKAFVDKVNFYETHIFKYSKRQGTKAAVMKDQVPEQIKTLRSNEMLAMDEKKRAAYEKCFDGMEVEVLMEEAIERNGVRYQVGHTKEYVKVALQTDENMQNQLATVRIGGQGEIIH
jgi:threonylcarbamoyladenosine tRNA methylthiotransferase MtaB